MVNSSNLGVLNDVIHDQGVSTLNQLLFTFTIYIFVFSLANHSKVGVVYHDYNFNHFLPLQSSVRLDDNALPLVVTPYKSSDYDRHAAQSYCGSTWDTDLAPQSLTVHLPHKKWPPPFWFHSNFLMVSCTVWLWLLLCQKHSPLSSPSGFSWLQDALRLPLVLQDPNQFFKITRALFFFYKLLISNNTERTIHTHKSNSPNTGIVLGKQDMLSLQSLTWEMTSWGNGPSHCVSEAGTQDAIHGIV